jgi:hypothetical protein
MKRLGPLTLLAATLGCVGWGRVTAGAATATTLEAERIAGQLTADLTLGPKDAPASVPFALDLFADGKVAERGGDGGLGVGAVLFPYTRPGSFFGRAGVHLVQVGVWNDKVTPDGKPSFGMFGPLAEVGVVLAAPPRSLLTLSTQVQLDLRFTEQPHEGFWSASLGVWLANTRPSRLARP